MTDQSQPLSEIQEFGNEKIEVMFQKLNPPEKSRGRFPELKPSVTVEDGIVCERDLAVKMRDGITIYTDIYRPEGEVNIPAIIPWSPYGKRTGFAGGGMKTPGVPETSPMTKMEGPDPAFWCRRGYAVINVDARGAGNSEGDVLQFCTGEGQDAYDLIEWVADLEWCNGKVGMAGNSWLAIAQWFAAAERPPHLAAIAPWEGLCDQYRDQMCMGGVPEIGFSKLTSVIVFGPNRIQDNIAMIQKYPLMNAYWEDKIAKVENIEIPAYVVASYNPIHGRGTFNAFRRLSSKEKWLRVHNTQEWQDFYTPEYVEDLRGFFDRYLKGIDNGWEKTPKVRLSVLDPGGTDQVNRAEREWPPARTEYKKLFLDANTRELSFDVIPSESSTGYIADDGKSKAEFLIKFKKDTELAGNMKLRLWVEAKGSNDMDLFVYISKLDSEGNPLLAKVLNFDNPGVRGILRVSHRKLDETKSTPSEPFLMNNSEQLLSPGEIVPVEIGIWPIGMYWHAGQQLKISVQGYAEMWLEDQMMPNGPVFEYATRNKGEHIIQTGGIYDSHLLIPVTNH